MIPIPATFVRIGRTVTRNWTLGAAGLMTALAIQVVPAQAQDFDGAVRFGSNQLEAGCDIAVDALGNIYSVGVFGVSDFDPGPGSFVLRGGDFYISKLDKEGRFVWAKQIMTNEGGCPDIAIDALGSLYITGTYGDGTVDFDPGPDVYNLTVGSQQTHRFLLKLNRNAEFVWAVHIEGHTGFFETGIAIDANGDVLVTGAFEVAKYDSSGKLLWVRGYGSTELTEFGPALAVDVNGNAYTADLNRPVLIKLNRDGRIAWRRSFRHAPCCPGLLDITSIDVDCESNIIIVGGYTGVADLNPGPNASFWLSSYQASPDIFIVKLDSAGRFVWGRRLGGIYNDLASDLVTGDGGSIYFTGWIGTARVVDGGPYPDPWPFHGVSDSALFVARLNAMGQLAWIAKMHGPRAIGRAASISLDRGGSIVTTGWFSGPIDFDPGTGVFRFGPIGGWAGNLDAFVSKLIDLGSNSERSEGER